MFPSFLNRFIGGFLILVLFLSGFNTVYAAHMIYESFVSTNPSKIEFFGVGAGSQTGASLITGDFNGDGVDDLATGAPFSSSGGFIEWNGAAEIIFGSSNQQHEIVSFYGEHSGDQLGTSLASGDFNGDGIDDLAIGAFNAYTKDIRPGKVYIFYGKPYWGQSSFDLSTNKADLTLMGDGDKDSFGLGIAAFDINNDQIDDLLVGSPYALTPDNGKAGAVYAFLGNFDKRVADTVFWGQKDGERFGSSISGGYINEDTKFDIVIGAYDYSSTDLERVGKIYFYSGKNRFPSNVKIPQLSIEGKVSKGWFGFTITSGDLNGDNRDDIAVSSFPYVGRHNPGKVSIFYGGKMFSGEISQLYDDENTVSFVINDDGGETLLGSSIVMEDFNNDNKADLAVGAPGIGLPIASEEGEVYMIYSSGESYKTNYDVSEKTLDSYIYGENADDWFGYSLAALDFNDDGFEDLAIGARYAEGKSSQNDGKISILLGNGVPYGNPKTLSDTEDNYVKRGEFVAQVMEAFNLRTEKKPFLDECYAMRDFCLFNFTAMSLYDGVQIEPNVILYPDVLPTNKNYQDITEATMLGLVNGFMEEKNSPFKPEDTISRIQALKVILGAIDAVKPMYRFELVRYLGSEEAVKQQISYFKDIDSRIPYMWWYPRYTNFALDYGIIDDSEFFRPDEKITLGELNDMIKRTLEYLQKKNAKTNS